MRSVSRKSNTSCIPLRIPNFRTAKRLVSLETLPRGTEFLAAETAGQKSNRETVIVGRDRERSNRRQESPQKRPVFDRRRFPRFGKTVDDLDQTACSPRRDRTSLRNSSQERNVSPQRPGAEMGSFASSAGAETALARESARHVFEIAALLRVSHIPYNYRVWVVELIGIEPVTPS